MKESIRTRLWFGHGFLPFCFRLPIYFPLTLFGFLSRALVSAVAFPPERLLYRVNRAAPPAFREGLSALNWILEECAFLLELRKRRDGFQSRQYRLEP